MDNYNNYYPKNEQNYYNPPLQEQESSKKTWLLILIPFLIIIIGLTIFYIIHSSPRVISSEEFSQGINLQLEEIIDCGSNIQSQETVANKLNFNCFIDASKNCKPSKLLNTVSGEIFGMVVTSTTYMELKGFETNKCIYYQRTEGNSIEFTNEMVKQMLENGMSQEEIDQQEQNSNNSAQQVVGLEKTCKFNTEDLTAMLNRWKEGSFSTEDWNVAECEGDY